MSRANPFAAFARRPTPPERLRPGSTFGPASEGRTLSPDEVKLIEEKLRRDGHL
jgi:hypothetical protein